MANIKSAKKRILVINKKTLRNKMVKSAVKTAIKKVAVAAQAGDKAAAVAALSTATKVIDIHSFSICGDTVMSLTWIRTGTGWKKS